MDDKTLKQKISKNMGEGWLLRVQRKVSFPILKMLIKTKITPNQISIVSLVLLFITAILISTGNWFYMILSIFVFRLGGITDVLDGDLARSKNLTSDYGAWLDSSAAIISDFVYVIAAFFGLYIQSVKGQATLLWSYSLTTNDVMIIGLLALLPLCIFKICGAEFHLKYLKNTSKIKEYSKKVSKKKNKAGFLFDHALIFFLLNFACLTNQLVLYLLYYVIIFWTLLVAQHNMHRKILLYNKNTGGYENGR